MSIEAFFDRLHADIQQSVLFQKFTRLTRAVLAVGFFAPGLNKLMGIPFTMIPVENPIGAFFNALLQTGFYYRFLGAAQVCAAILVLFRSTATLGALVFFGITMNVFIITISIPFGMGTPVVTGLMFAASIYLVCWDYPKIKPVLPFFSTGSLVKTNPAETAETPGNLAGRLGYWIFVVAGIILTCEMRGLLPQGLEIKRIAFLLSATGGLVMIGGFIFDIVKRNRLKRANFEGR